MWDNPHTVMRAMSNLKRCHEPVPKLTRECPEDIQSPFTWTSTREKVVEAERVIGRGAPGGLDRDAAADWHPRSFSVRGICVFPGPGSRRAIVWFLRS